MYMFKRNNYTFINGRRSTQSHITISMHAVGDTQKHIMSINKGNKKITEVRTILQRESQNS